MTLLEVIKLYLRKSAGRKAKNQSGRRNELIERLTDFVLCNPQIFSGSVNSHLEQPHVQSFDKEAKEG